MPRDGTILRQVIAAQAAVLRVARDPRRYGLTFEAIECDTGIPASTLRSYCRGDAPAEMPLSALWKLAEGLPLELVNRLMPPGFALVRSGDAAGSVDDLAGEAIDFAGAVGAAHHPASEAGVAIGPGEAKDLAARATRLRAN